MNIRLNLDDANWQSYFNQLANAFKGSRTLLAKALTIVFPKEAGKHFEQEMGPENAWAPWKESTRQQRIMHEIRSALGKQHSGGRLTAKEIARGKARAERKKEREIYRGKNTLLRAGGRLLQVTGTLRKQTVFGSEILETSWGAMVVSPTPYSGYLDEGTPNMAARPFMWLGDDAQETLARVFLEGVPG